MKKISSSIGNEGVQGGYEKKDPTYLPPMISYGKRQREVLGLLKKGYYPSKICEELGISKSRFQQISKDLMRKGVLKKRGSTFEIISELPKYFSVPSEIKVDRGLNTNVSWGTRTPVEIYPPHDLYISSASDGKIKRDVPDPMSARSHNIKLKFEILQRPSNESLNAWKKVELRNNIQFHKNKHGMYIVITNKHILVELPPMQVSDADDSLLVAAKVADELKMDLEAELEGFKLGDYKSKTQLVSQHHAIQNHPFAKYLVSKGISISSGSIHVDASDILPELEFTDKDNAAQHYDRYIEHVKDVVENESPKLSELSNQLKDLDTNVKKIESLLLETAQTLKSTADLVKINGLQIQSLQKPKVDVEVENAGRIYYSN